MFLIIGRQCILINQKNLLLLQTVNTAEKHQIICATLGGKVTRADVATKGIFEVHYEDGRTVEQLFTQQDHVVDPGEMKVVAGSDHCNIVACEHPTRVIRTVQFHPETLGTVLDEAVRHGEMTPEDRAFFGDARQSLNVSESLGMCFK